MNRQIHDSENKKKHELSEEFMALDNQPALKKEKCLENITDKFEKETLFDSDDDLDNFLDSDEKKTNPSITAVKDQSSDKETVLPPIPNKRPEKTLKPLVDLDLSAFILSEFDIDKQNTSSIPNNQQGTNKRQLLASNEGINGSILIDVDESEHQRGIEHIKTLEKAALKVARISPELEPQYESQIETNNSQPLVKRLASRFANAAEHKAIQQKAQFDEYFGRSLPQRELNLEFGGAILKQKKKFDTIITTYEVRKLISRKGITAEIILHRANEDLSKLVKCKMATSKCQEILDTYLEPIVQSVNTIINRYEKRPCTKGDQKRLETLEQSKNSVRHLISGYKRLYSEIYESANHLYGPRRHNANKLAFTLIDLLCLEQHLMKALLSTLPVGSSRVVNNLYFALSLYEPQTLDESRASLSFGEQTTIKKMFLWYQIQLAFNTQSLSASQHKIIFEYFRNQAKSLHLLDLADVLSPDRRYFMIDQNTQGKPFLISKAQIDKADKKIKLDSQSKTVLIEIQTFFNQIRKDYKECVQIIGDAKHKHSNSVLTTLSPQQSLASMAELNRIVTSIDCGTKPQSYSFFQPISLKVYAGFQSCVDFFEHHYAKELKKITSRTTSNDEQTAETPKMPNGSRSDWLCAMEDSKSLWLQTSEDRLTIDMDIGMPLLMIKTQDNNQQIFIALLNKLERVQHGKLNLVVDILGTKTTIIKISTGMNKSVAGLLTLTGTERYLIAPPQLSFYSGQQLQITLVDSSTQSLQVAHLCRISQKIQLIKLC